MKTRNSYFSGWRTAIFVLLMLLLLPATVSAGVLVADNGNNAIKEIFPNGTVAVVAFGFIPTGEEIYGVTDVAVDTAGNIYFVNEGVGTVMKKSASDGSIALFAGSFTFGDPYGIAVDPNGDVFVADNPSPRKVFAENESVISLGAPGGYQYGITADAEGNVFTAGGGVVRKRFPNGTYVIIGSGFSYPGGVAVDSAGNVYVTDSDNDAIKKVTPEGEITTIGAGFNNPQGGVALDSLGNVYAADYGNNVVKKIYPNGTIETIASGFNAPWGVDYRDDPVDPVPPVANFTASPLSGDAPLTVQFTDASATDITAWAWDFNNDGTTDSTDQSPLWEYAAAGTYSVNLSVVNASGTDTEMKTDYITVTEATIAPVAAFTMDVSTGPAPLTVQFTDASANTPTAWEWDFNNDGTIDSTEQSPAYTYTGVGMYSVSLNVSNSAGFNKITKNWIVSVTAADGTVPLPSNRHIFFNVANNAGVKYDFDGSTYNGPDNTYYIKADGGGLNELHLTTDPAVGAGQVTAAASPNTNPSGTFYASCTGGRGFTDDMIVLLAVNGTIPDDFAVDIRTSGYNWTPNPVANALPTEYVYGTDVLVETFTKEDFLYAPHNYKPGPGGLGTWSLPIYYGQNPADGEQYSLLFIDTKVGNMYPSKTAEWAGLTDAGSAKVEFQFHNLTTQASFNVYGWMLNSNQGEGISWTNKLADPGASGYSVVYAPVDPPVAAFTMDVTSGPAPLTVQFTDDSENTPTAWAWDFNNDGMIDSTEQNPEFTYTGVGMYSVSLNASNAGGFNAVTKNWIIAATEADGTVPLPSNRHIFLDVANDAGIKYDFDSAAYSGPAGTYYVKADGGGLNELRITSDAAVGTGQVTAVASPTRDPSGTIWVSNTGGRGFDDDVLVMIAVNGTIPDDFSVDIRTSGYTWTPNATVNALPIDYVYGTDVLVETFTKEDFAYGPHNYKPGPGGLGTWSLPLYYGHNPADGQQYHLLVIDTNVGNMYPSKTAEWAGLTDGGSAKVEFQFHNLTTQAAINAYGWCLNSNQGQGISWTNKLVDPNANGYSVVYAPVPLPPVVNFVADNRTGDPPLFVQFTDTSSNNPTAWAWDFQNDLVIDSTEQNPNYTYLVPGTYQVNLTASNAGGSGHRLKANFIIVNGTDPNLPGTDFTSDTRSGPVPLTVHFTDTTTNNPTAWAWDFQNDGVIDSTEQNATFTYTNTGTFQVNLTATNAVGSKFRLKANYITVTDAAASRIGVYRSSTHLYYQDYNGNGVWNGAVVDRAYNFGMTGDLPVSGDWNNDGISEIGVYRPSTHTYYQDYNGNGVWNGAVVDRAYNFGMTGDLPVSGDWNNDGISEIGVYRPSTHTYYQDYNGNGVWNGAVVDRAYNFGMTGDLPVSGDWNNDGISEIGVYRPSTHTYYQDYNGNGVWNGAVVDRAYNFGMTGDLPVSGDWNSDGISEIGIFRPSTHLYYQDYNGNGVWNGAVADRAFNFGITGDTPVAGAWV
jgi:PKD repeat protein